MKHKRIAQNFIMLLFFFFILTCILWNSDLAHNTIARIQWTVKKQEFKSDEISKISFYTGGIDGKEVDLTEKDNKKTT